ncbi:MAG: hypothetical protein ACKO96_17100, partial [Flammeovirgaceae bacterium]
LAKGRTSSNLLSPILEQIAALLLATSMVCIGVYVATDDNPADGPSRHCWIKRKTRKKWLKRK